MFGVMAIKVRVDEGAAYLKVTGDVDMANANEVQAAALELLEQNITILMLDLTELEFMDSAGVGALVAIRNEAVDAGKMLRVDKINPKTRRLLDLMGLTDWFVIEPSD